MQRVHGVYAEEAYSMHGGLLPKIPLLCECDFCKTQFLAFSQEFAFVQNECIDQDYAKIPGKNRLFPGNWIYLIGAPRPGKIKRITTSHGVKNITIDFGYGTEQTVDITEQDPTQNEESPRGYRLLPAQCGETLIGDNIYHVFRHMFGKAIGMVQDVDIDKLVVQLENGTILFMTLPEECQPLPNIRLQETVKGKLQDLSPRIRDSIRFEVRHGILQANGIVRSLADRRKIQTIFNSIKALRGTINHIKVEPEKFISDTELLDAVHKVFENTRNKDFAYYKPSVNSSKVTVKIGYYKESAITHFENELENLQGVQELTILPEFVQEPTAEECRKMRDAESICKSQAGKDCKIRVTFAEGRLVLSGRVNSLLQKRLIQFQIVKFPWNLASVENNLRIVP